MLHAALVYLDVEAVTRRHYMKWPLCILLAFVLPGFGLARAETMVTSHFRAKEKMVAAHRKLPIGTRIRVANPQNGKSLELRVAGRGPFIRGRQLDVSEDAAKLLGFGSLGILRLDVTVLGK